MERNFETACLDQMELLARQRRRWLPLGVELSDLIQEAHVVLARRLGKGYLVRLGENLICPELQSEARQTIRQALQVAHDRLSGTERQRARRKLPRQISVDPGTLELSPDRDSTLQHVELACDIHEVLAKHPQVEREVWRLLCEDKKVKVQEIANQVGLDRRHIPEIRARLIQALSDALRD